MESDSQEPAIQGAWLYANSLVPNLVFRAAKTEALFHKSLMMGMF
jgi:hypothetical protein